MGILHTQPRQLLNRKLLELPEAMANYNRSQEVGILYFLYGFFFFLVGGLLALLFRIQLALPENDFLTYDEYNSFFTLHGTTMIFLAAMPMIAGFMNYILPLQIGAKDLAFPRINALGFWLIVAAAPLIFTGVWSGQAADITWVIVPPYSSLAGLGTAQGPNAGTIAFIAGMGLLGASSTLSGVNFITTAFTMRGSRCWLDEDAIVHMVCPSIRIHALREPACIRNRCILPTIRFDDWNYILYQRWRSLTVPTFVLVLRTP